MNLRRTRTTALALALVTALLLAGCNAAASPSPSAEPSLVPSIASPTAEVTASPSGTPAPTAEPTASPTMEPAVTPQPPTGVGFTITSHPEADALFLERDDCQNLQDGYQLVFPDDWYTNTEIRDVPACSWFSPEFYTVAGDELPDEIAIEIFWLDGAYGYLEEPISRDEGMIAGPVGLPDRDRRHLRGSRRRRNDVRVRRPARASGGGKSDPGGPDRYGHGRRVRAQQGRPGSDHGHHGVHRLHAVARDLKDVLMAEH